VYNIPASFKSLILKIEKTKKTGFSDVTVAMLDMDGVSREEFAKHFEKLFIPQSVVDEIEQERLNCQLLGHHVGMRNGDYVKQELTDEDHKRQEKFYSRLLALCRSDISEIVAPIDAIGINSSEFDKMCKAIGCSSVDAILLSKEKEVPLTQMTSI